MGLFRSGSNKTKGELTLMIDIGSASVGAAVVEFFSDKRPFIHHTVRVPIAVAEKPTFNTFLPKLLTFLSKALDQEISQVKKRAIKHVHCFYASPWYTAESRTTSRTYPEQIKITQKVLDELIDVEVDNFMGKLQVAGSDEVVRVTESHIISTRLNGYATIDPLNKKATDLSVTLFLGVIPDHVIKSVEGVIHEFVHAHDIEHHSFPLTAYSSTLDVFPHDNTFLFVDITGEVTDLYLVRDDVLEALHSFPSGRNILIRSIAEKFDVSISGAVSYIGLYASGSADDAFASQIKETIDAVQKEWKVYFTNALTEVCKGGAVPDKTFCMVDNDVREIFSDTVRAKSGQVVLLHQDTLDNFCDHGRAVEEDPFIIFESLFVHKLYSQE